MFEKILLAIGMPNEYQEYYFTLITVDRLYDINVYGKGNMLKQHHYGD